jgi:hypothetical protein
MVRFALLNMVVLALAAAVWGGAPVPLSDVERARQLQRDQELIESLVDSGLALAATEDPLQRAGQCNKVAERLASEIRHAGADRDSGRVKELGQHLKLVLENGVADNLRIARTAIVAGSPRERALLEFSRLAKQVESQLDNVPNARARDMTPALNAVRQGRQDVENAIKGKTRIHDTNQQEKP